MAVEARINYNCEDIDFSLSNLQKTTSWITQVAKNEGFNVSYLDFIFCSDNYLLKINKEHLNHDTFTDIITFNYNEEDTISGDIFISIDRVKENAHTFAVSFEEELHRVIIHGVLHLLGFNDKTEQEKKQMRQKENESLKLFFKD